MTCPDGVLDRDWEVDEGGRGRGKRVGSTRVPTPGPPLSFSVHGWETPTVGDEGFVFSSNQGINLLYTFITLKRILVANTKPRFSIALSVITIICVASRALY